jgi:uncharacterized protein
MIEFIKQPWPWYVAGPLIGLFVPLLLLYGNKNLGISSSMRHMCAAVLPTKISFFNYDWRSEKWNLIFVVGVILGGVFAKLFLWNVSNIELSPSTIADLQALGLTDFSGYAPSEVFQLTNTFSLKGILFFLIGGFLVGFGTRYANGCTSGHSIFGLATLNWPSLVATICFMIGGFISAWFIVPLFLKSVI